MYLSADEVSFKMNRACCFAKRKGFKQGGMDCKLRAAVRVRHMQGERADKGDTDFGPQRRCLTQARRPTAEGGRLSGKVRQKRTEKDVIGGQKPALMRVEYREGWSENWRTKVTAKTSSAGKAGVKRTAEE